MAHRFQVDPRGQVTGITGIILAAGASSRMGRSKADLLYRGETFLSRLVRLLTTHCDEVVVVTAAARIAAGARVVVNPAPQRGMLSSLQCGLREAPAGVLFTPVDIPAILPETLQRLVAGWPGDCIRIPRFEGRRGHPVLAPRAAVCEWLALAPDDDPRVVIRRHTDEIEYVDTADPGILKDVDTPADYETLK